MEKIFRASWNRCEVSLRIGDHVNLHCMMGVRKKASGLVL